MPSENVELVQRAYAFFASVAWPLAKAGEDVLSDPAVADLYRSDIVIEEIAEFPDADRYGYDGMVTWLEGWAYVYEKMRITPSAEAAPGRAARRGHPGA